MHSICYILHGNLLLVEWYFYGEVLVELDFCKIIQISRLGYYSGIKVGFLAKLMVYCKSIRGLFLKRNLEGLKLFAVILQGAEANITFPKVPISYCG